MGQFRCLGVLPERYVSLGPDHLAVACRCQMASFWFDPLSLQPVSGVQSSKERNASKSL